MHRSLVSAAKWLWVGCVAIAAAFIVARSWHDILRMLRDLSWWWLLISVLLTIAAKLFLGENARVAAVRSGVQIDYIQAFRLYNLSQIGKYLPGSVWQFIGRAAAYRHLGAAYGPIRDALLCESLWIVAGALIMGFALVGTSVLGILEGSLSTFVLWWIFVGLGVAALCVVGALIWKRETLLRYSQLARPPARVVVIQACTWLLLGLAFWVLAGASGISVPVSFAIGLFALGYAIGFLVPIAPAGLGIRDGILTLGLMPYLPAGEAMAVSVMARLIYMFVDLLLASTQDPVLRLLGLWRPGRMRLS